MRVAKAYYSSPDDVLNKWTYQMFLDCCESAGAKEAMLARPPALVKAQELTIVQYTFKFVKGYIIHTGQALD